MKQIQKLGELKVKECIVPNDITKVYTYSVMSKGRYRAQICLSTTIPDEEFFDIVCDEYRDNLVAIENKNTNVHMWFNNNYPIYGILDLINKELDRVEHSAKVGFFRTISVVADSLLKPFFESRGYKVVYSHNSIELYIMQLTLK